MSIEIIKLVNGEEVIGDLEKKDEEIIVDKPAKVLLFPTEEGEGKGMGMALMPWLPYSNDETASIKSDKVITIVTPTDEIKNEYSQRFGTGVVSPPDKKIIS